MAQTHYDVLGVAPTATKAEIRSAYRRLVLQHHPDRSNDSNSKEIFLKIKSAYDVLADEGAKRHYDERLEYIARQAQEEAKRRVEAKRKAEQEAKLKAEREATPTGVTISEEILRLQGLYGKGRHFEAEKLAYSLIQISPRQAVPYAVLADIMRGRGDVNEASKMYAYAAQMDPTNPVYQRRYEALLNSSQIVTDRRNTRMVAEDKKMLAPMVGGSFVVLCGIFVALSSESAITSRIGFIATWTTGLMVSLFLSGVGVGAALAVGNWLDRFDAMTSSSSGRAGPTLVLGMVAMVNFWVSAILYVLVAVGLRAFNYSTTRLMSTVSVVTIFLTLACIPTHIHPLETFFWGGNLVYVGGLVGWMATDSMRP